MRGSFRFGSELCVGASLQVVQNAEHAPRSLLRCVAAPQTALRLLGGALAMISAQWFACGCLRVTHRMSRSAMTQNANLESEREGNPQTWGSR